MIAATASGGHESAAERRLRRLAGHSAALPPQPEIKPTGASAMSRPTTNYGIRVPSHDEVRKTFGSLARAADITGGDLHTLLFYLHNADLIEGAARVERQPGEFATEFCEAANVERAGKAWDEMAKPTIIAVADQVDVCRSVARRLLVSAGKVMA